MDKLRDELFEKISQAVKNDTMVAIMIENNDTSVFRTYTNPPGVSFDELKETFLELPFMGMTPDEERFDEWSDYFSSVKDADIFSFELEDGKVQIAVIEGRPAEEHPQPHVYSQV